MKRISVAFKVNGKEVQGDFPNHFTLLRALRELGFTEVKNGCEKGDCGSCTVLFNGRTVNSCLVLIGQADGQEITTVKGLGTISVLHPLQENFMKHGAVQCGFCTPGMLLSAKTLLDKNPSPTREEIRAGISGNLCRCTGYEKIIDAIEATAVDGRKPPGRKK
ncbi:MAG TPA: (2Fe-2S)-binding protein [Thermodesulfobacteriota bacterium]|nr:(2Fe-2S)-binding protein [Thermodesulfobacteriota bacterium]